MIVFAARLRLNRRATMKRSNDYKNTIEKETLMMNKQDKPEANNSQILIEDLTVNQEQAGEVKGGPTFVGGWGSSSYQYGHSDPHS
jgi:hypothetical protein